MILNYTGLVRLVFLPSHGMWALEQKEDSGNPAHTMHIPVGLSMAQALRDQGIPNGNSPGIDSMVPVQLDIFS